MGSPEAESAGGEAMNFTVIDCEQRSEEWRRARLGRLTGSCAHDMLTTIKSGESAARRNLRVRLVLERITGQSQENDYVSIDMQNGIDREPDAFGYYEALTGTLLERVGFLQHNELMAGCSPDGVIGDFEGLVSIKCPKPATHLDFLETGTIPLEYLRQCTHELVISGAQWVDFLSFHPAFPEPLRAKLVRVEAKQIDLVSYEGLARFFLKEVDAKEASVRALMRTEAVA